MASDFANTHNKFMGKIYIDGGAFIIDYLTKYTD